MGNGAKIGLVGVLAAIVLVVAIWDRSNDPTLADTDPLGPVQDAPAELGAALPTRPLETPTTGDGLAGQLDHNGPLQVAGVASSAPADTSAEHAAAAPPAAPASTTTPEAAQPAEPAVADAVGVLPRPEPERHPAPAPAVRPEPAAATAPSSAASTASDDAALLATYTVQPGDTLSRIAARFYGSGRRYYPIIKANRDRLPNPDVLPLGIELRIPRLEGARRETSSSPRPANGRTYTVQPGDTLYRIARKLLGDGKKFRAIFEANRDRLRSPDDLRVGMQIVIPRG